MFEELTIGRPGDERREPPVVRWLQRFGLFGMGVVAVIVAVTEPRPGLTGDGLLVSLALALYVAGVLRAQPRRCLPPGHRFAALVAVLVACLVLMALQPSGAAIGALYFVVVITALRFPVRLAVAMTVVTVAGAAAASVVAGTDAAGVAAGLAFSLVPWVLVLQLIRHLLAARDHERQLADDLRASRDAEADAVKQAERGRLARDMHDVLAHSLSALALQLEGARLLARDRGSDAEVVDAIERARHLATTGLDEARGAIAALRGDELPGPEQLRPLTEAFAAHSDATCALRVEGEPPALTSEASLALYRTAQEALTNVRKHAAARHVDVALTYAPDGATLVVQDHGPGAPIAVGAAEPGGAAGGGYGLTGMRERAELLGGRLVAGPTGDGFRVELWVPA